MVILLKLSNIENDEVGMKVLMIMHDDDTYGAPKSMLKLAELLQKKYHVHPIIITPKANKVNTTCDDLQIENYAIRNWRY